MLRINTFGALVVRDGERPLAGAAAQPRRLAVLAVLARAGERGVTRDKLLALLWPDSPDEPGRRALAQALYALRRDLGSDEAFLGVKDVRLNPDVIGSDAGDFEAALADGELERAVGLYGGAFLDGFRVPGLEDFDRWIETERAALALRHAEALEALAERAGRAGDHAAAAAWWRRLAGADPLSARVAVRLMQALDAAGDRAGALQHARIHESLVDAHLGLPPSPEVTALAERLRSEPEPARPAPAPVRVETPEPALATASAAVSASAAAGADFAGDGAPSGEDDAAVLAGAAVALLDPPATASAGGRAQTVGGMTMAGAPDAPAPMISPVRRPLRVALTAVAAVLAAGLLTWHALRPRGERGRPLLAVGRLATYTGEGHAPAAPLADLLATGLARVRGVRVVSRARLFEGIRGGADTTAAALAAAARDAGATQLIEGDVYPLAGGRLRLDLRRVDLGSGAVIAAYRLEGSDPVALADAGAARIAGDLPRGSAGVEGVTTSSPIAYRLYERGLSAYTQGDMDGAARLFDAALAEDSSFAMAAWYAALAHGDSIFQKRVQRAIRLAAHASDRERLIIRAAHANLVSSPALLAVAETLAVRYPREPAGPFYRAMALLAAVRPIEAIPQLRRVIELDAQGFAGTGAGCMACDAMRQIVSAYEIADSAAAAEREARRWTELQPRSAAAWLTLYETLEATEHGEQTLAAYRTAVSLNPALGSNSIIVLAQHLIVRGEYARADQVLREQIQTGDETRVVDGWWYLALSLREQGRLNEALQASRASRASFVSAPPAGPGAAPGVALLEAQLLYEMGRYRQSAALFDSIARLRPPDGSASSLSRHRAWVLTHRANALAALGDTARLPALADTVRLLGQGSFLGRDHRLYHHINGLLYRARGDLPRAATQFRAAMTSPNVGYTRTNLALATVLLRMNRPRDAVAVLQPALRGSLEASNLYVNRIDVHMLLGRAWQAAGQPDSAAAHFSIVRAARAHADTVLLDTMD